MGNQNSPGCSGRRGPRSPWGRVSAWAGRVRSEAEGLRAPGRYPAGREVGRWTVSREGRQESSLIQKTNAPLLFWWRHRGGRTGPFHAARGEVGSDCLGSRDLAAPAWRGSRGAWGLWVQPPTFPLFSLCLCVGRRRARGCEGLRVSKRPPSLRPPNTPPSQSPLVSRLCGVCVRHVALPGRRPVAAPGPGRRPLRLCSSRARVRGPNARPTFAGRSQHV